jgi:transcription elongation factor GreA
MPTIPITVLGADMLRDELHRLKTIDRPNVITAIAEARAQGDLSENAEYDAARERLSNAQIIDPTTVNAEGRVVFGATVEMEDLESGSKVTYQIVGDDEADIKVHKISISSPLARSLIGKSPGDVTEVKAPGGVREYEIIDVRYL